MRLEFVHGLQLIIIAFISYIITISFAGWFEALIAQKVGDDTPEQAGFLTLNPLEHFNVFGFAAVLWGIFFAHALPFQFIPGWGRHIPLVPDNIRGQWYRLRIFIEYAGRSFAHLIILICAATCMMLVCGVHHVHGMIPMLTGQTTSFTQAIIFLLYFICQQNLVLFVIHAILGFFKYLIYFYMPRIQEISFITMVLAFIVLCAGLSIFGPILEGLAAQMIAGVQSLLLFLMK